MILLKKGLNLLRHGESFFSSRSPLDFNVNEPSWVTFFSMFNVINFHDIYRGEDAMNARQHTGILTVLLQLVVSTVTVIREVTYLYHLDVHFCNSLASRDLSTYFTHLGRLSHLIAISSASSGGISTKLGTVEVLAKSEFRNFKRLPWKCGVSV